MWPTGTMSSICIMIKSWDWHPVLCAKSFRTRRKSYRSNIPEAVITHTTGSC